jgi:hypothetical protein
MPEQDPCRQWLRENGYHDIAELIDGFIEKWKAAGKQTRRNWWDILAGGKLGRPRSIEGYEFPVLKVVQLRQRLPVTANAISRAGEKLPPPPSESSRWPKRRRKLTLLPGKSKKKTDRTVSSDATPRAFPRSA